jgi:hypothetical protein
MVDYDREDEEITLRTKWRDVRKAFVKAKEAAMKKKWPAGQSYKDDPAYQETSAAMDEMRTHWRRVGEAVPEGDPGHRRPVAPVKGGKR